MGRLLCAIALAFCTSAANAQGIMLRLGDETVKAPSDGVMLIVDGAQVKDPNIKLDKESFGDIAIFHPPLSQVLFGVGASRGAVIYNTKRRLSPGSASGCAESEVYFEYQIDQPAVYTPISMPIIQPIEHEPASKDGTSSALAAQFVVDTVGHVELRSFKILNAPSEQAAFDARSAAAAWHFKSAMKHGCRVKQVVLTALK